MTTAPAGRISLVPEDDALPLRREADQALLELVRASAATPAQLAHLSASMDALRSETREGLRALQDSAQRTEASLARLVALQEQANGQRAAELDERREAGRWWRSLVTPQGVLYIVVVIVTLLGALMGLGQLVPPPRSTP